MTLQENDVIDVVTHDEDGRRNLRRVRVINLRTREGKYVCEGVNMQGGNAMRYHLPKTPIIGEIERTPNSVGWVPFDNSAEADE